MQKPPHVIEIYLQPGELWFGDENTRVRTVLGSCVAITLWHPQRRIGGMCHYMLPSRARQHGADLDGRYGDEAMALLIKEVQGAGSHLQDFEVKLFGGGRMFQPCYCEGQSCASQVHDRNIDAARVMVAQHGLPLKAEHLGGHGHRQVIFDVWSGHAWLKHTPLPAQARCSLKETA
jgi:chemotaxis protein CheD